MSEGSRFPYALYQVVCAAPTGRLSVKVSYFESEESLRCDRYIPWKAGTYPIYCGASCLLLIVEEQDGDLKIVGLRDVVTGQKVRIG